MEQLSNTYKYKELTVEIIEKAVKQAFDNQSKQARQFVLYTSELGGIEMDCQINFGIFKDKRNKYILFLFSKLLLIRRITLLNKIKKHHIDVGYSLMTKEDLFLKMIKLTELKEDIIKEIKTLYYGKTI